MTKTMMTTMRSAACAIALLVWGGFTPGIAAAQEAAVDIGACNEGGALGSLGVQGISCRDCSFSMTRGGVTNARFGTEPEITAVDPGSSLRSGDVLVALDGLLITTREGAGRLTSLPVGMPIQVRVRRGGEEREMTITTQASCRPPRGPEPPLAPRASAVGVGPEPRPVAEAAPLAPAPPAVSSIRPNARLGFGFECDGCVYQGTVWSFPAYPRVYRVEPEGPADGLLRPGDELRAVNGRDITQDAGGEAFSALRPDREVVWTVWRNGRTSEVRTRTELKRVAEAALEPPRAPRGTGASSGAIAVAPESASRTLLRYAGTVGDAQVEVRGGAVTVSREGNVLVIRTARNEIRIVVPEGGEGGF